MAESQSVWGIDIGQAGLKAIRLRYAEAASQVVAVAFDYVPHAKILSQPDAVPDELIQQALATFLSRNETKGDKICISVPGPSALTKFIQLPPVEAKKIADIVKYEARQQIPFALEDVIWDWQPLGSGVEEGGYMIDTEVGLFAMKRDAVMQHLRPFTDARCEPDLVQVAPLALYNFICYDVLGMRPGDTGASDYVACLDMGADNTTFLVTNGRKIFVRNIPLGGNHFTRALTKEMKLTFAKAEHLKCNATKSPDPKAVFQALRPVFNDFVSEVQRSIGFFSSVNRDARLKRILGTGNGFKLAGLQKFLQQNLQYEVERAESFGGVVGDTVLGVPLFQENILSFAVPYGLALQGLNLTPVHTSLLPPEIRTARMIRQKKPWALVAAATLLVGLSLTAMGAAWVKSTVSPQEWGKAEERSDAAKRKADGYKSDYETAKSKNKQARDAGAALLAGMETRTLWMELDKAINECLPQPDKDITDPRKMRRIRIHSRKVEKVADLKAWFDSISQSPTTQFMSKEDKAAPPSGPGWVVTLEGLTYYDDGKTTGNLFVRDTLLTNLQQWEITTAEGIRIPVGKQGISHAAIVLDTVTIKPWYPNGPPVGGGTASTPGGFNTPGGKTPGGKSSSPPMSTGPRPPNSGAAAAGDVKRENIPQTDFVIQFAWKETPADKRLAERPATAAAAPGGTPSGGTAVGGGLPGTPAPGTPATPGASAPGAAATPGTATPGAVTPGAATPGGPAGPMGAAPMGAAPMGVPGR